MMTTTTTTTNTNTNNNDTAQQQQRTATKRMRTPEEQKEERLRDRWEDRVHGALFRRMRSNVREAQRALWDARVG